MQQGSKSSDEAAVRDRDRSDSRGEEHIRFDAAPSAGATLSASEALKRLLEGNRRFVAGRLEHPRQSPARRDEVANLQIPLAATLSCSDSRTVPEIVFDVGLGDLFAVRVAGNLVDHLVIESLDFAVRVLRVKLLFVMGHRRCGAVQTAVAGHGRPAEDDGPILREIRLAIDAAKLMAGDLFVNAERENVRLVTGKLARHERFAPLVNSGELKIVGAVYDLDTGIVNLLDR